MKNPWKTNEEKFTFSNTEAWKPATLLETKSFRKDLRQILIKFFGNVLQFLRTVKTLILQNILHGYLWNWNKDRREISIRKEISCKKKNRQRFQYISFALSFFQGALDWSGRSSREFISQSINCEQASLPLKRINIFFVKK